MGFNSLRGAVSGMEYKLNMLTECQKQFLFNSKYGLNDIHPDHNAVDFICEKRNIRYGIYIPKDCIEDYFAFTQNIIKFISSYCEDCEYRK